MPPTSFFDRAESAEDNEDVEPDLESILDECLSANMPTMNLNWHYRSRHESLIAFSNSRYYNGDLVTFPSPVTNDRAVSLHHVKGVYDRARHMVDSGTSSDGLVQGMAKVIGLQKVSAQSKGRLELAMRCLFRASDL